MLFIETVRAGVVDTPIHATTASDVSTMDPRIFQPYNNTSSGMARLGQYLQSVLRIAAALIFIPHGTQKLFAFPAAAPRPGVPLVSQLGIAGILEVAGGLLMLIGLFSRQVAVVLAGEMAVAYFIAHAPRGRWPILNGGELAVLFCFIWLFFGAAGPGPLSLDAILRRRR